MGTSLAESRPFFPDLSQLDPPTEQRESPELLQEGFSAQYYTSLLAQECSKNDLWQGDQIEN